MTKFILTGKPISSGICLTEPKQAENAEQLTLMSNGWTWCLSPAPRDGRSEVRAGFLCSLGAGGGSGVFPVLDSLHL